MIGIDISHHNGDLDLAAAAAAGYGFAMIKATEGTDFVDPRHEVNVTAARKAGLTVGHYHYMSTADPAQQAAFFTHNIRLQPGDILALDWEGTVAHAADPAPALAWLEAVEKSCGVKPLIYMNRDTLHGKGHADWSKVHTAGFGLWLARPDGSATTPWPHASMTQTGTSTIPGITGPIDVDNLATPPAEPAPKPAAAKPAPKPAVHAVEKPAAATAPGHAPAAKPAAATYVVERGDTLSGIARATHTTVRELVRLNSAAHKSLTWNPNLIQPGWRLALPAAAAKPAAATTHRVVAGDTLSALAADYHTTVAHLVTSNEHKYASLASNPDRIEVGWELTV